MAPPPQPASRADPSKYAHGMVLSMSLGLFIQGGGLESSSGSRSKFAVTLIIIAG